MFILKKIRIFIINMTEKERYEKTLNIILKKQYPFFEKIKIGRYKELFSEIQFEVLIYLNDDFISKHIDRTCYDQMDEFMLSSYSFEKCSNVNFNYKEFESDLKSLFKMTNSHLNKTFNSFLIHIFFLENTEDLE
jgi:hypothetical protein